MSKIKLAVILGTNRENNQSQKVAGFVCRVASETGHFEVTLVDPSVITFEKDGNDDTAKNPEYSRITDEAEAFIIVTPEYNRSFPGSLKRMLDTEMKNYTHKPVLTVGVSSGIYGGSRVTQHLQPILRRLGLVSSFMEVNVAKVQDVFEDGDEPNDDQLRSALEEALVELKWLSETLKWGRQNLENKHHMEN